jgi:excinuclease ABC subunit C
LERLQELAALPRIPERIEGFDISNIQGVHAVGSMVVWEGEGMKKDDYRHFRIQSVAGPDDFAMMQEVIHRRYSRLQADGESFPDLIVVDGGKGQLNAALEVLHGLGIPSPSIVGLAKERVGRPAASRSVSSKDPDGSPDRIFFPGISEPVPLAPSSPAARILQRIRDEAHRFAVQHHRKLRGKEALVSELDGITGIGRARKLALLRYFGGVDAVLKASPEEIGRLPRMNGKTAEAVWEALHHPQLLPLALSSARGQGEGRDEREET